MLDLIIYIMVAIAFVGVGWIDRDQTFKAEPKDLLAQEEGTNGAHD